VSGIFLNHDTYAWPHAIYWIVHRWATAFRQEINLPTLPDIVIEFLSRTKEYGAVLTSTSEIIPPLFHHVKTYKRKFFRP